MRLDACVEAVDDCRRQSQLDYIREHLDTLNQHYELYLRIVKLATIEKPEVSASVPEIRRIRTIY